MSEERRHQGAHTMLPNLMQDWLLPLFPSGASKVLMYVLRHTVGFADPTGQFGRKEQDVISVEQFLNGISIGPEAGPRHLFDVGCGLASASSVKTSIEWCEGQGLLEVRYVCPRGIPGHERGCNWQQARGEDPPPPGKRTKAPACPRCSATCTRSFALAAITPSDVIRLLNEHDRLGRQYVWDPELQLPQFTEKGSALPMTPEEKRAMAIDMRNALWYPKLVDFAAKRTESYHPKQGKLSVSRYISGFYRPVLDLQDRYPAALLKMALEETINRGILDRPPHLTLRWYRYAAKVCESNLASFNGHGAPEGSVAAQEARQSLPAREKAARDLLARAAEHNNHGHVEEARVVLGDLLAEVESLAELFGGDEARCEAALREAFKQGAVSFVTIAPDPTELDFYPEWSWPADVPRPGS